ncbi:hypothetical protein [Treponema primitia]|uniref:hypothetical protein n=1 Tax=Treponema primitia TaxID=88058 RepID=UPI0002555075|nr:hypothetical protein [Treponema primitia]
MKKTSRVFMLTLIGLLFAGSVWAQDAPLWGHGRGRAAHGHACPTATETVTINGNLQLIEGHIAVAAEGKTYYINGPVKSLVGFVDGLKEGSAVRLEGPVTAIPFNTGARVLWVTKLTFNGKTYDFPTTEDGHWL